MTAERIQFWKTKRLKDMTRVEWELLCDGCGLCCLHNFKDGKTGKIKYIAVSCRYLDISKCRCMIYEKRRKINSDCMSLSPNRIRQIKRLPRTCAYRSLVEGRELDWWHPLVSGDPDTVHRAGISVRDKVVSGGHVHPDDLDYFCREEF
jgi:uncharacterized cysteine cluster protein YcgN (CxxCxxCC family)